MRIHNCNRDTVMPQAGLRTKAPMHQHIRNPLVYTVLATFPRIHVKGEKGGKKPRAKKYLPRLILFIFFSLQENGKEVVDKKQPEPASSQSEHGDENPEKYLCAATPPRKAGRDIL